jgi:N-acetylneuraminate synthase
MYLNTKKFIISEIGSNHNVDLKRCYRLIDQSKKVGCDAVKFQYFTVDTLFRESALKKNLALMNMKKWELPLEFIPKISEYCKKKKILFGISPFNLSSIDFLNKYVDFFKIASYEMIWDDLLKKCAKTKKPIIISTGMANEKETQKAFNILKKNKAKQIIFMHCVSNYPVKVKNVNLAKIDTLRKMFKVDVGFSDHTVSPNIINRAFSKWDSRVFEFHFDLDKKGYEFKAGHCWLPDSLEKLIKNLDFNIDQHDGNGKIKALSVENNERMWRRDTDGFRPILKKKK